MPYPGDVCNHVLGVEMKRPNARLFKLPCYLQSFDFQRECFFQVDHVSPFYCLMEHICICVGKTESVLFYKRLENRNFEMLERKVGLRSRRVIVLAGKEPGINAFLFEGSEQ